MGAVVVGIGALFAAWALWHDWRAAEREKKRAADAVQKASEQHANV